MIDIHIHTNHSDGTYSVKELLEKAEELKLKYISITDHDTISAYEELKNIDVPKYYSGKIIPGIELKCVYNNEKIIEILGYNYNHDKLKLWLDEFYKDKKKGDIQTKYFNHLYSACEKYNLKMTPKEEIIWNPNKDWASIIIYNDIKKYEENREKLPEDLWEKFNTFTKKYCSDKNSLFYLDKTKDYPNIQETIKAIKDADGIAIVAHVYIYDWAINKEKFIQDLYENYDIDGFECYHNTFTDEESAYLVKFCKEHNLLMSGGSDCHGKNKPSVNLGTGKGNLNISDKIIENWVNNF